MRIGNLLVIWCAKRLGGSGDLGGFIVKPIFLQNAKIPFDCFWRQLCWVFSPTKTKRRLHLAQRN